MAQKPSQKVCALMESYYPVIGGMESQASILYKGLIEKNIQINVVTRRIEPNFKKKSI